MIVVTTPTGQIGSKVVRHLLAAGDAVRVIVRDPSKLAQDFAGTVEVVQGSHDDAALMTKALAGAESLFLVVPPLFTTEDDHAYYMQFTRAALAGMKARGVKRIVAVSALGKGSTMKAGPVTASLAKDQAIVDAGVDFRALWAPSFMENTLTQLHPLKQQGMFFLPADPDLKTRFAATRDIASSGARLLLDRTWSGQGGLAVLGPEDLSFNDQAAIMSEVLGTPIRFQPVPPEAYKAQLLQFGASEHFAQGLTDLMLAKQNGLDNAEPRTPQNTTPTSFRQWCEEELKLAFQG